MIKSCIYYRGNNRIVRVTRHKKTLCAKVMNDKFTLIDRLHANANNQDKVHGLAEKIWAYLVKSTGTASSIHTLVEDLCQIGPS